MGKETKYLRWYKAIIAFRQQSQIQKHKGLYCETHHIVPKSLGGTNDKSNLVNLLAREHYIVHCLLVKHFETIGDIRSYEKMLLAWNRLSHCKRLKINSKLYEKLRIKNANRARSYKPSEETRLKCSLANLGKKSSDETKTKQSLALKGKKKPKSYSQKLSKRLKGNCFIYNTVTNETKFIKRIDLDQFLKDNPNWIHKQNPHILELKRQKSVGTLNPSYGKKWIYNYSSNKRLYISEDKAKQLVQTGNWAYGLGPEVSEKCSNRLKGHKHSELTKQKIGNGVRNKKWMYHALTLKRIRVNQNEIAQYKALGYCLGQHP